MFELADRLVGIYKVQDVTRTVTIVPKMLQHGGPLAEVPVNSRAVAAT